jgi:hypothetical protein
VTDVETQLPPRLHALADDLAGGTTVSAEAVLTTYRRRRRTRAGLLATAAVVAAIAVGVPVAGSALGSAPTHPATPAPLTTDAAPTTSAAAPTSGEADAEASASIEARRAELAAAAAAAQAAMQAAQAQAQLEAVHAQLPSSLALTSPVEWDQWLPEGKPIQGTSPQEDMRTCPRIAAGLGAALGQEFSYWQGTLPQGPIGCTWVPTPLKAGPEAPHYPYLLSIGFLGDGTTVGSLARSSYLDGLPKGHPVPCPRMPIAGGGLLLRCDGSSASDDYEWTLLLPDHRGAGLWVATTGGRTDAARPSSDAFVALVQATAGAYG